jgi:hypothetical protein
VYLCIVARIPSSTFMVNGLVAFVVYWPHTFSRILIQITQAMSPARDNDACSHQAFALSCPWDSSKIYANSMRFEYPSSSTMHSVIVSFFLAALSAPACVTHQHVRYYNTHTLTD